MLHVSPVILGQYCVIHGNRESKRLLYRSLVKVLCSQNKWPLFSQPEGTSTRWGDHENPLEEVPSWPPPGTQLTLISKLEISTSHDGFAPRSCYKGWLCMYIW